MVLKGDKEFAIYGKRKGSVPEETSAGSGTAVRSVQNQHPKPLRKGTLRGRSPSGRSNRQPCKNFLKGTCTKLPCDNWYFPECQFD